MQVSNTRASEPRSCASFFVWAEPAHKFGALGRCLLPWLIWCAAALWKRWCRGSTCRTAYSLRAFGKSSVRGGSRTVAPGGGRWARRTTRGSALPACLELEGRSSWGRWGMDIRVSRVCGLKTRGHGEFSLPFSKLARNSLSLSSV